MGKVATGGQLWKLQAGSNDTPTLTPGTTTKWQLNDVPDRCPTGPLAYYLPFLLLTITGTITQPEGGGTAIPKDQLCRLLIASIDWNNAWHGTPVSADHVLGQNLRVVEFHAGGFEYAQRQSNEIGAAAGAATFTLTIAVPASDRRGGLVRETSQLALLYQPSNFKLNMAAASVLDAVSDGAVASNLVGQLSAYLDPRQEIVCGTPVEWIQHQIVAGGNAVKIDGFGRDTMLSGVEQKGGVLFLGELTSENGQGGVFESQDVTEFAFNWRGQQKYTHIDAWFSMLDRAYPNWRTNVSPSTYASSAPNDYNSMPFAFTNLDGNPSASSGDRGGRLFFPIALGGNELRLTDLQTADRDETYFLTVTGGFDAGDHLVLAQYAKVFTQQKQADFVSRVCDGGPGSLAAYVLGQNYAKARLQRRAPPSKHVLTPDQYTYLALQFA
jgi:hypothetical protein